MKIVHVVEPFASGVAHFVQSLVEHMRGDENFIIHGERKSILQAELVKREFSGSGTVFIPWKSIQRNINLKKDLIALRELTGILRRLKANHGVDVVHLHSSKSGFLGRLACRLTGIGNVIYTPNGAPFLGGSSHFKNRLYNLIEWIGAKLGGKTVCCSRSEWQMYGSAGIPAVNINNGIDVNALNIRSGKKNSIFTIVTSARIVHQKNPRLFNEIAEYFSGIAPIEFIWIGDGEERHVLTSKNIRVTGWLPVRESKSLIASADLYLSTSLFEGLSIAVLEALSLKKPVLLHECVGNIDQVRNGLNGDLFATASQAINKILKYFNNPEMMKVMGSFGRAFCKSDFDISATYQKYRQLYTENIRP